MKTKILYLGMIIILFQTACMDRQSENVDTSYGWNWSSNREKEQEHYVILTDNIKLGKYEAAKEHLNWLLKENPKLNPSLYKSGFTIYENLIKNCNDPRTKILLKDEERKVNELLKKNFPFVENGS